MSTKITFKNGERNIIYCVQSKQDERIACIEKVIYVL